MPDNYLKIMTESLQKKVKVLDNIMEKNEEQAALIREDGFSFEQFDEIVAQKEQLIRQLNSLDRGFDSLYEKVKEELSDENGRAAHREEIAAMQELIRCITEKSSSIMAQENRNKQRMEQVFRKEKEKIRAGKKSSKAAVDYYRSMNQTNYIPPQFLDQKN